MSASRELLTEYQQQLLTSFQDITQIQEEQLCIDLLQQNGWSLESAVNNFMQGPSAQESSSSATRRRPEPSQPTGPRSSNRVLQTEEPPTNQPAVADGSGLLDLILLPFRWLFKPQQLSINPNRDAENFISEFNSNYDLNHVPFHNGSYQSAVAAAFQQSKFLIVYIHSPLHEDTDTFCQQVLCNQSFINFVNENTIVWGGRVWDPEAYGLSSQLSVSAFPFLGLLICQSARTVQVADRVQGILEVDPLITRLRNVTSVYSAIIERNRMEAHRREESIRLREQQDREYQESIEAERRRIAEEEAQAAAEEARRQEEELAAAVALSQQLSRQDEIRKIKAVFQATPEPAQGPDISTIRFQLPRGKKLTYRFHKLDKAQRIQDYLRIHFSDEGDLTKSFSMNTTHPKMEITDFSKTIEELGLHPRGMLYVQDNDV